MLLTVEHAELLEADGKEKYKAKKGLTDEQLVKIIELDEGHKEFYGDHLVTNIKEVKAEHRANLKMKNNK